MFDIDKLTSYVMVMELPTYHYRRINVIYVERLLSFLGIFKVIKLSDKLDAIIANIKKKRFHSGFFF